MRNTCYHKIVTLFALLFLCSVTYPAEDLLDYVVTVGSEQLRFVAQPEAGYVIKTSDGIGSMDSISRFLKSTGDVKISPIRGLGRKGVCIVYNERSAVENDKTIKSLRVNSEVQYTAPLFSSNGETVAIIPEIVIRVKSGTEIEQVETICETVGCTIIKPMEFTTQEYLLEVSGPDAEAVFAAVEEFNQAPEVEWACPNTASQPKLCSQSVSDRVTTDGRLEDDGSGQDANSVGVFPNDEYFPMQWHLHNTGQSGGTPGADIRAPEAWEITTGDPNRESWVQDDVTSPCIDTGDPNSPVGDEPMPNGGRINMGAYGGTAEASISLLDPAGVVGFAMRANHYIENKKP